MKQVLFVLIRAGLLAASGALATKYGVSLDPESIDAIAGGLAAGTCFVGAIGWSIWEKRSIK